MTNENGWQEIPGGFFHREKHLYANAKKMIVPSTTQVFRILGCDDFERVPPDVLEWKRNYGIACHRAIELLVAKDLDWDSCDEQIIPAVTGLEEFLKKHQYEHEAAEEIRIHTLCGMEYGLTVDLRGSIIYKGVRRKAIIDLKSGVKYSPTWKWQCGGYTVAHPGHMAVVAQFDKTGEVEPHWIDVVPAQREFQTLLAAANLKLNNGMAKVGG